MKSLIASLVIIALVLFSPGCQPTVAKLIPYKVSKNESKAGADDVIPKQKDAFHDEVVELPNSIKEATERYYKSLHISGGSIPSRIRLRTKAIFNKPFKDFFGSRRAARRVIKKLFDKANRIYKYPGLDVKIKLHLDAKPTYDGSRTARQWSLKDSGRGGSYWLRNIYQDHLEPEDHDLDHYVFFIMEDDRKGRGIATQGSICARRNSRGEGGKVSIVAWQEHNPSERPIDITARIFAHEVGHALGMDHDHEDNSRKSTRRDSKGVACNEIQPPGVMSYRDRARVWSSCSNEDLMEYLRTAVCLHE